MTLKIFNIIVLSWIFLAVIIFPLLLRTKAPYGRHYSDKWGPRISNRAGWVIMEFPALAVFVICFLSSGLPFNDIRWLFAGLWILHYTNRVFIYPFRTRTKGKKMPLLIVALALLFNVVNSLINAYWLGSLSDSYYIDHANIYLFAGIILFISGFIINLSADNHLLHLRKDNFPGTYLVPHGRLFRYISCPNYAGEIIEWTGFAIMTHALPGLSFAIWTAANLIPRAIHHHQWYRQNIPSYPDKRKAIIPRLL